MPRHQRRIERSLAVKATRVELDYDTANVRSVFWSYRPVSYHPEQDYTYLFIEQDARRVPWLEFMHGVDTLGSSLSVEIAIACESRHQRSTTSGRVDMSFCNHLQLYL